MKIGEAFPSNYLKASDFDEDVVLTIKGIKEEKLGEDDKLIVYFKEMEKGLVLNKTNATTIAQVLNSDETDDWKGKRIGLTVMPVTFQGKSMDAIRVKSRAPKQLDPEARREALRQKEDDDLPF